MRLLAILLTCVTCAHAEGISVDGKRDEPAWQNARLDRSFKLTQPDTGEAPDFETRTYWMAAPEGLAFFFENDQDSAVHPRLAPVTQRDNAGSSDRVNIMVDFDGTGQSGYNFTLTRANSIEDATISNENFFNPDWDGLWYHAVREREGGWDGEILVPWSTVLMREAGATRSIGLYLDRVTAHKGLRAAVPNLVFFRPQFLSLFAKHEIKSFRSSLFKVYPYLSTLSDQVSERIEARAGLDLFWKPSGEFQLTAALNPDFGQVEADDLVVNFDAVEVFFSDRRPFFTENQSLFVIQSPEEEPLIYTRRVGAGRDDGEGVSDIDAALKLSGSFKGVDYGVFAASERDADTVGRRSGAVRFKHPTPKFDLGYLGTYVERPFLDREASLHAVDARWLPSDQWQISGVLLRSDIDQGAQNRTGFGGFGSLIYKPAPTRDFRLDLTRYDRKLDFNDLGFQRRRDLELIEPTLVFRKDDYPESAWLRSHALALEYDGAKNLAGRSLSRGLEAGLDFNTRQGSVGYAEIGLNGDVTDDLISRGNGLLQIAGGASFYGSFDRARRNDRVLGGEFYYEHNGYKKRHYFAGAGVKWFVGDNFSLRVFSGASKFEDRLLWRSDRLFGRFDQSDSAEVNLDLEWYRGNRHELRGKLQWLAITGRNAQALELQSDERLYPSAREVADFAINSFGVQLRYRYKINMESDLYVVYSRGGESSRDQTLHSFELFDDSLELRDADQFLVKIRYGF